jgi:hypothetical protein
MNISDKIAVLKANIASAISVLRENLTGKGVVVEDNETLTTLVGKVNDIQQGGSIDALMEQCGYTASIPSLRSMILDSYEMTKDITKYGNLPYPDYGVMMMPEIENPPVTSFSFRGQFDLVAIPEIDCTNVTSLFYSFADCSSLREIHFKNLDIGRFILGNAFSRTFFNCRSLKKITGFNGMTSINLEFADCWNLDIPYIDTSKMTIMSYYFPRGEGAKQDTFPEVNLSSISENDVTVWGEDRYKIMAKNMSFAGVIKCHLRMIGDNYTRETMLNLFEHLYDYMDGTTHTIEIGSVSLARLSDDDKSIATNKNWTLI